jgi:polyferredoxin
MSLPSIAPKRKLVQWLSTLLILGIPFVRVGGESLLRLDASSRTLYFFGAGIRIEEFYLFLLAVLILVFGFLFITMVFGRVWCGWFCPQTTVTDLAEFIDRKAAALVPGKFPATLVRQLCYLLLSFLVAANLVWYFIPPAEFMTRLLAGDIGLVAGSSLVTISLVLYFDLVYVRRSFCKLVCPYGRIQLLAMDRSTLTLEFDPSLADACIHCGACERACPMGIDIKDGLQIECINCGRCLDACRKVMAKRGGGLIHYTFGTAAEGGGHPLNSKSVLLAGVILLLGIILGTGVATRPEATIKVRSGGEVRRVVAGAVINSQTAYVENRSARDAIFEIFPVAPPGVTVVLLGPVKGIRLPANGNQRVDFIVKVSPVPATATPVDLHLRREGKTVAVAAVTLRVK